MCDFPLCLRAPEMVKRRPVIVVNPHIPGREGLVNIVPISMTAPNPLRPQHCQIAIGLLPLPLQSQAGDRWAKCDMIYTLSVDRLSLVQGARNRSAGGKRIYYKGKLDLAHLQAVRRAIASTLGIGSEIFVPLAEVTAVVVSEDERAASNS